MKRGKRRNIWKKEKPFYCGEGKLAKKREGE